METISYKNAVKHHLYSKTFGSLIAISTNTTDNEYNREIIVFHTFFFANRMMSDNKFHFSQIKTTAPFFRYFNRAL